RVEVAAAGVRYTLADGEPIDIGHAGRRVQLVADATQTLPLAVAAPEPRRAFPQPFKALIFDLDGVLADTAHLHHAAWKRLAGEIGLPFDEAVGAQLRGVDRAASLEIVLGGAAKKYTAEQKREFAERKNGYYRTAIAHLGPQHLLAGAHRALTAARQ